MSITLPLRNIYYPSKKKESSVLIIMHGLGDQMESYRDFPDLLLKDEIHTFLFNAPDPYFVGWKWYDLEGDQEIGLKKSRLLIEESIEIIQKEFNISKNQIFLSGFSQGGVVSLYTGLRSREPYGGLICLSGYLYGEEKDFRPESKKTPIFMSHGIYDDLIPAFLAKKHKDYLNNLGYNIFWKEYPMPHTITIEEIEDLKNWLKKQITNKNSHY